MAPYSLFSSCYLYTSVSDELEHTSASYVDFIDNWFHYRETDAKSWASSQNTLSFMQELNTIFDPSTQELKTFLHTPAYIKAVKRHEHDLINEILFYHYIYDLFIIETLGNILYTITKEDDLGTNLFHGKYASTRFAASVQKSLKEGQTHFSDLERYAPSNNGVYGFFTTPIRDGSKKVIGILAIQIKPDRISMPFKDINKTGHNAIHYLLGGEDLKLRTSMGDERDILVRQVKTLQTEHYQQEHIFNHMHSHDEDIRFYDGPDGIEVIGKHHPIEILDVKWVLISEMNKDQVLATSYQLAYKIFYIALIALLIVIFSAYFISKKITRPILILTDASEAIDKGDKHITVDIQEKNEIGTLATAFNNMLDTLMSKEASLLKQTKETQQALNALKEQKYALDAHSIIAITDIQGTITYVNKKFEQISGYSKEELIGQNHRILKTDEQSETFWKEMYRTISKGNVWHNTIKNRSKDGHFYWVDTTIVPFMDENRKPTSYIAIRTDITSQKENEVKLIQAKEDAEAGAKAKAEFLASMSHEIRTPMNGILGMLGLLKNSELTENQKHQLHLAESSAQSLLVIINDILDFSKVEAGKIELEELEFNLRDELGDFAEAIAVRAQEKDLELILDVHEIEQSRVITDPGRLRQIMGNIVGNAIKFTHQGEILITCKLLQENDHEGRLFVSIKDTGIGIPEEKLSTLFDSFTQVDASTTREYGGTGLGLSIAKRLVELMGGSIQVESISGEGSTFHFDIPLRIGEKTNIVFPDIDVKDKKVLIIDDNPLNRKVLKTQLECWGMIVTEAEDGISALETLEQTYSSTNENGFDILLVDMHMPQIDGTELGRRIKNMPECTHVKLVMMTSLNSREDYLEFADIGFGAYFPKPTTTQDLFSALNVLVDNPGGMENGDNFSTIDTLHVMSESQTVSPWPEKTRLLLVEDNMTNQIVANGILENFGLQADIAGNGEECLIALRKALKSKPYTLVLMDCQMPVLDGYGAAEAIREGKAGEANRTIPIVAMTANAMKGDKEHCITSGMDDYLSKPIHPDALEKMLLKWLKKEDN